MIGNNPHTINTIPIVYEIAYNVVSGLISKNAPKNNNTIDNNFFYMCENYQVQLLGKIFEKNEFSKYDGINKNTDDFEKIMSYVTEGKVLKAILNSKNDFFNLR